MISNRWRCREERQVAVCVCVLCSFGLDVGDNCVDDGVDHDDVNHNIVGDVDHDIVGDVDDDIVDDFVDDDCFGDVEVLCCPVVDSFSNSCFPNG